MPRKKGIARDLMDGLERHTEEQARTYWMTRLLSLLLYANVCAECAIAIRRSLRIHRAFMAEEPIARGWNWERKPVSRSRPRT